jgi:hypothetical protein
MRPTSLLAAALVLAAPLAAQQYPTAGTGTVAIRAARIIDGTGAAPIQDGVVVITGDRIVAVGPTNSVRVPVRRTAHQPRRRNADAGLHRYARALVGREIEDERIQRGPRDYPGFNVALGTEHARLTLMAGFTSARNGRRRWLRGRRPPLRD